jgi:hypothetical protein
MRAFRLGGLLAAAVAGAVVLASGGGVVVDVDVPDDAGSVRPVRRGSPFAAGGSGTGASQMPF